MKNSKIGWTDHTFNPWWGCSRVSPGCRFCYAETFAKRVGQAVWGEDAPRRFFGEAHWREPLKWDRAAAEAGRPALVFCASMADVFEDHPEVGRERRRLLELVQDTPNLRWLLLTKRPENVRELVPWRWITAGEWPENVWIGTTVEDQQRADERIPVLLEIPAPVRFLSCEPLLGPVKLHHRWFWRPMALSEIPGHALNDGCTEGVERGIGWVIVGGESGPHHRPFHPAWARGLAIDADHARAPFFFKQHGGLHPGSGGHLLDGELQYAWPAEAGDRSDVIAAALAELETPVDLG